MDVGKREDLFLEKIQALMTERDALRLEVAQLEGELRVAVEAALVR